jgi:hypothetical protein
LMGKEGVEQLSQIFASMEADPDAFLAEQEENLKRAEVLMENPGDGVLPSRRESIKGLSALAYRTHVKYTQGDLAESLVTVHLAIRAAYHLGVSDARLQMFGDAVAESDEGE